MMIAQLDQIELNYEWISPDSLKGNEVLLFLHEALGSIGQWKDFPQLLCNELGLKGIVYERQGHGKSSPLSAERTNRYLHEYALLELPLFIESLNLSDDIILVGHSDGGSIALLYTHVFPEKVKACVTMAAHVINESETIAGIAPAVDAWNQGKLEGLRKYHGDNTAPIFWAWANIWRDDSFTDWDITKEIGSNVPHLCIQGKDDQYGTSKQLKLLEQFVNAETLLLDKCGHHPHLEQKEKVIQKITAFINSH